MSICGSESGAAGGARDPLQVPAGVPVRVLARPAPCAHPEAGRRQGGGTETLEASLQLSAFVLEAMELDEGTVDRIVDDERDACQAALLQATPHKRGPGARAANARGGTPRTPGYNLPTITER